MSAVLDSWRDVAASAVPVWPKVRRCGGCGDRVIHARHRHAGRPFVLEACEVFPIGWCGHCSGSGQAAVKVAAGTGDGKRAGGAWLSMEPGDMVGRVVYVRGVCMACGGRGTCGEELVGDLVALNADGIGRRVADPGERFTGEALHRPHRCCP